MSALLDVTEIEVAAHQSCKSRSKIYDLDAWIKTLEATIPPGQRASSPELTKLREELNQARAEYAASESRLEALKARHAGGVALANLLAAYVQAGRDTSGLEAAIAAALGGTAQEQPAQANGQKADGTATGTFTVTEARATKSPGVVRAYCLAEDGSKVAVYGKNGNGQALAGAVGQQVVVKYRQGDKGLIALGVRLAG